MRIEEYQAACPNHQYKFSLLEYENMIQELEAHQAKLEAQNEMLYNTKLEYEALFLELPMPIVLVDEYLRIKQANQAASNHFHINKESPIRNSSFLSILPSSSFMGFMQWSKFDNILKSTHTGLLHSRSGERLFEITATRYPQKQDWFILTLTDKEYERELSTHNERLQQTIRDNKIKRDNNYQQILFSLLDMIEKRDPYTAGHAKRVAYYSVVIAEAMGIPESEDIQVLYEAAIMHDIGKVSTPDTILLKPGNLSYSEYEIIKDHLNIGYEILSNITAFQQHAEIIRNHHERHDGMGYPRGLTGDKLSLFSRIMILADAFDAMTSRRVYKEAQSLDSALQELKKHSGSQFSPDVVDAAIPALKKLGIIPVEQSALSDALLQARVAYYYKDSLTGLYNYNYFEHILYLSNNVSGKQYKYCYFININNFQAYNDTHGWVQGDKKLKDIAHKLTHNFPDATLFRVYGDDFLILSVTRLEINENKLKEWLDIEENDLKLFYIELEDIDVHNFDQFSQHIEGIVKEIKQQTPSNTNNRLRLVNDAQT